MIIAIHESIYIKNKVVWSILKFLMNLKWYFVGLQWYEHMITQQFLSEKRSFLSVTQFIFPIVFRINFFQNIFYFRNCFTVIYFKYVWRVNLYFFPHISKLRCTQFNFFVKDPYWDYVSINCKNRTWSLIVNRNTLWGISFIIS